MHKILLAPLVALALAAPAHAATPITSTFDSGTEGWKFGSPDYRNQTPDWDPASASLTKTSGVAAWGYLASAAYLGDKSEYVGGNLSFDFASDRLDDRYRNRPFLVLNGANNQTIYANWGPIPVSTMSSFSFRLTASNFYKGTSTDITGKVSDAEFAAIMADLKVLEIFSDWSGNVETTRLDNVVLSGPAPGAVPEPGTWALMIVGFGAAGATLRRRRAGFAA